MPKCEAKVLLSDSPHFMEVSCEFNAGHDDPMNEVGSTRTVPFHSGNVEWPERLAEGVTNARISWRTPGMFGEKEKKSG